MDVMGRRFIALGFFVFIVLTGLISPGASAASAYNYRTPYCANWPTNLKNDISRDFQTYFQPDNMIYLGNYLVAAGIFANTGLDSTIQRYWQDEIAGPSADRFFKPFKDIGALSYYYFPIYLTAVGIGAWQECTLMGNVVYSWGYRSLRTILLSTLQSVTLAYVLGSGRPSRGEPSKWQPFRYKTGVSGHAQFGAVPFLTAAWMTDPPVLRYTLFAVSTLPGLSRINSNAHYFSQVLLGWGIAFLSSRAIYMSDQARSPMFMSLIPKEDGVMLIARYQF